MKQPKRKLRNLSRVILIFVLTGITSGEITGTETTCPGRVTISGEAPAFLFKAENTSLLQIINELEWRFAVTFAGLEGQMDDRISMSCSGSVPNIIEKLLKTANIKNCAFIFNWERLTQVIVIPYTGPGPGPSAVTTPHPAGRFRGTAVEIRSVNQGSQAERVGLEPDDIIITYNGHKITHARDLISQVKKDASDASAHIVILREGNLHKLNLESGSIGIWVFTIPMDIRELKAYYNKIESG